MGRPGAFELWVQRLRLGASGRGLGARAPGVLQGAQKNPTAPNNLKPHMESLTPKPQRPWNLYRNPHRTLIKPLKPSTKNPVTTLLETYRKTLNPKLSHKPKTLNPRNPLTSLKCQNPNSQPSTSRKGSKRPGAIKAWGGWELLGRWGDLA